jgi:PKD repeat protein
VHRKVGIAAAALAAAAFSIVTLMRGACLPQESGNMMPPMGGASPSSQSGTVNIPSIPQITVAATPSYGIAPLVVGFFVTCSDPEAIFQSYRWNFGDGQVSTLSPVQVFHTYATAGTYVVTLTVTMADGHQATGFAGVIVKSATTD